MSAATNHVDRQRNGVLRRRNSSTTSADAVSAVEETPYATPNANMDRKSVLTDHLVPSVTVTDENNIATTFPGDDAVDGGRCEFELDKSLTEPKEREGWDNKAQYMLAVISSAVGLGNVWRFPYLCQQNGGGAFLIPYVIMMLLEGMPLFLIEMGIGQKMRVGPIGVWNTIHPNLGGIGISQAIISFLVGLYYNVIITWCFFYMAHCFQSQLPWAVCPNVTINGTATDLVEPECDKSSETQYFWYRIAIESTGSIGELGGVNWRMALCLIAAWFITWTCVCKGIKSSGKVMYITATFPYIVTTIFFVRAVILPGAGRGVAYMFTPDVQKLMDPRVWLDAAAQIFYSMSLAFGGLIAFSSYNPLKNDCKKDVMILSAANLATSLYTAICIFSILGFKGHLTYQKCLHKNIQLLPTVYPAQFTNSTLPALEVFEEWSLANFTGSYAQYDDLLKNEQYQECDFNSILQNSADGTGLAFIVFAQVFIEFPGSPFWGVMFFLMLLMLGLGSMFGMLEGVITSIHDLKLVPWLSKIRLTAILCTFSLCVGFIFVTRAGEYWVKLFDAFAGSYALLAVAFFECIAVVYVYGWKRFCRDIEYMGGDKPGLYWTVMWRFVAPVIMVVLFVSSLVFSLMETPTYDAYNREEAKTHKQQYPPWALIIAGIIVFTAMAPVPFVFFVRFFKIWKLESDIPGAVRNLNTTQSTMQMLRSQLSFGSLRGTSSQFSVSPQGHPLPVEQVTYEPASNFAVAGGLHEIA